MDLVNLVIGEAAQGKLEGLVVLHIDQEVFKDACVELEIKARCISRH